MRIVPRLNNGIACCPTSIRSFSKRRQRDDGATLAYRSGEFAQTVITCTLDETQVRVDIEEHFDSYRPQREWYDVIVHTGTRVLHMRLQAGQGRISHTF